MGTSRAHRLVALMEQSLDNEAEVYFGLIGDDFDPGALTEFLGVEPTRAKKKGEPRPKESYWIISSGKVVGEVVDIYEMSSQLVKKIKTFKDKINVARERFNLESYLEVVLWITADESKPTPIIGFDPEVIAFLHDVGASIDIDTYRNSES